jgi:hypothetical protein
MRSGLFDLLIFASIPDSLTPSTGGRIGNPLCGANLEILGFIYIKVYFLGV